MRENYRSCGDLAWSNPRPPSDGLLVESGHTTRSYAGLMAVVMMISTPMCMSMRVGFTIVVMLMRMLCPGP